MSDTQISQTEHGMWGSFVRDYGMVFVLLVLVVLFSILTISEKHPAGAEGGRQIAEQILERGREGAGVLILTRDTGEDRRLSDAIEEALAGSGLVVRATVHGAPADARRAVAEILARGESIDFIAANDAVSGWGIFDKAEGLEREKLVTPPSYRWPTFLTWSNLSGVANQTAIYAIIAVGMTMVIITAGIDLSVGSLVALASVTGALLIRDFGSGKEAGMEFMLGGLFLGVLACGLAGAFNGAMVTAFRVPAFIATLAMMLMASGLAYRLSQGASIPELPPSFFWLGSDKTLGLPNPVWLMIGLYAVAHIVMTRTTFGRYVYAIGGNEEAARLSGVPVRSIQLAVYTISGALAGLGGIVLASQLHAGDPKFGLTYELEVIAAVVVGGTSLYGGSGKILGTLIGAFIIAVIKNGMNLINIDPFSQDIVLGAVLLAAVLIDNLKRRV